MISAPKTLGELAFEKAQAMCDELAVAGEQRRLFFHALSLLGSGWFATKLGDIAPWKNDLTDDGTPFELSAAFSPRGTEVRVLTEPQKAPYGTRMNWLAGLELHEQLRAEGCDLSRFDAVAWLFEPAPGSVARFAMWHAIAVPRSGPTKFKVYLNPQLRGKEHAVETTKRAFELLGLRSAWQLVEQTLAASPTAELTYFSLDLESSPAARVKVYLAFPDADVQVLERALIGTEDYVAGEAQDWVESVTLSTGPFTARPMLVCYQFSEATRAPRATLHVPVRSYNANDAEVVQRMTGWIEPRAAEQLVGMVSRIGERPLELGRGLISYVSFQRRADDLRVAAYLAPQAYAIAAPRRSTFPQSMMPSANPMFRQSEPDTARTRITMSDVQQVIEQERDAIGTHPFLRRMSTASVPELRVMAETLTFWVLCFQDVMRLGARGIRDPRLARMAHTHAEEDSGHDQWFLQDIKLLGAERDLRWVFSVHHERVRDVSYAVMSEVLSARHDCARLAALLSVDVTGGQFFGRAVQRLEALGMDAGLRYFARTHQDIEEGHDVFEHDTHDSLMSVELTREAFVETSGAVRRTFAAMRALADELEQRMAAAEASVQEFGMGSDGPD